MCDVRRARPPRHRRASSCRSARSSGDAPSPMAMPEDARPAHAPGLRSGPSILVPARSASNATSGSSPTRLDAPAQAMREQARRRAAVAPAERAAAPRGLASTSGLVIGHRLRAVDRVARTCAHRRCCGRWCCWRRARRRRRRCVRIRWRTSQKMASWAPIEAETARTLERILATEFVDEAEVLRQIADSTPRVQRQLEEAERYEPRTAEVRRIHETYVGRVAHAARRLRSPSTSGFETRRAGEARRRAGRRWRGGATRILDGRARPASASRSYRPRARRAHAELTLRPECRARRNGKSPARSWTGRAPPKVIRRRPTLPHGDHAVPSALEGLTAVFGMGTGVSPPPSPPETGSTIWTGASSRASAW